MSEETKTDPEHDVTTPEDVEQAPRGNPDTDREAVEKGKDTLERVKPY
jgi:hypothetical protein